MMLHFSQANEIADAGKQLLSEGTWGAIAIVLGMVIAALAGAIVKLGKAYGASKDEQIGRLEKIIPVIQDNATLLTQVADRLEKNKDDDNKLIAKQIDLEKQMKAGFDTLGKELGEVKGEVRTLATGGGR